MGTNFVPSKVSYKAYQCSNCGHEKEIQTNHYGECYGYLGMNLCSSCSWKNPGKVVVWKCLEPAPGPSDIPTPWTQTTLGALAK